MRCRITDSLYYLCSTRCRSATSSRSPRLLETFGSLAEVIAAPEARLAQVKGLGDASITELKVIQAAASRFLRGAVKKRPVLSSWSTVLDYCRTTQAIADREQFRVLFLDKRNQLIADETQQVGTVDHTPVYPREVVKRALELSATHHPRAQSSIRRSDAGAQADLTTHGLQPC
jgi:DNA repair protein RadC